MIKQHYPYFFILISLALCTSSLNLYANNIQTLDSFSKSQRWQKLLHYNQKSEIKSYVTSDGFFLDINGARDPLAELKATIKGFYRLNTNATPNDHPQCLFPARFKLITQNIDLSAYGDLKKIQCTEYDTWRKQNSVDSFSIVFASGYMSNPASMYGHLFLKINDTKHLTDLLNTSINYGAIVPKDENPILYVMRGIFGSYDAGYSDQDFYHHHHNYGDIELRDMWEYKLALSPEDIELLTAHLWELLQVRFDYFFIDENCAFHIAKFLEVVLEEPLISDKSLWVIPSSVAKGLEQATHHKNKLLTEIKFIPSRETLLHQLFKQLTVREINATQNLLNSHLDFTHINYQKLNLVEKQNVLEVLFEYHNVIKHKDEEGISFVEVNLKKLITERINLPPGRTKHLNSYVAKQAPHMGNAPSRYSLGYTDLENGKKYLSSGFRMTYFDDLSSNVGRAPFSNLEMIDIQLITDAEQLHIYKVDLIDISSLYQAPLPWGNQLSSAWSVRAGYEQLNNNCVNCGVYFAEGRLGKSIRANNDGLFYALVGGKIYAGAEGDIALSLKLGYITSLNEKIKLKINIEESIETDKQTQSNYLTEVNYQLSKNWEVRFQAEKERDWIFSTQINYFWDFGF